MLGFVCLFVFLKQIAESEKIILHGKSGVKNIPDTLKCKRQGVLWFLLECVPAGTFF